MFRRMLFLVPVAAIAVGGSTACATKKFVRTSVGQVNDKVDSLGRSVEETQERTRQNEGKIAEVDQKAAAADQKAQQARRHSRPTARTPRPSRPRIRRTTPSRRPMRVDKASKRLVYEVVLSEDQGNFKFGKKELPDEAKAKLDEMIQQIKADPKGAYFEIEGHTDSVGGKDLQREARSRARRSREAVSVRAAPDSVAQDERHQLRRRQAGGREQDQGRPRAEPPRRHPRACLEIVNDQDVRMSEF